MSAGKTSLPSEFKQLGAMAQKMIGQTNRPRKLMLRQLTEALRTGGVHAKIPMIQQAVSRANQATATATAQTAEQLASRNIGGPFASRILAGQRLAGEQTAAAIPTQMAQQLIAQTTPFLSATQSLGAGALAQTGQASFASDAFNAQQFKALMEDIKDSLMGAGQMAACLHPDTPIDTPEGQVAVKDLDPGDSVWSLDAFGKRVVAQVDATAHRFVGAHWEMLEVETPYGSFFVSPAHPLPDGLPIERLFRGARRSSSALGTLYTYDLSVASASGVYFVNGLALGSTLDGRHARRVA